MTSQQDDCSFDEDVDALKAHKREWRYFHSLGPLTVAPPKPVKSTSQQLAEAFILYFTPFGLIAMAIWPDAFSD